MRMQQGRKREILPQFLTCVSDIIVHQLQGMILLLLLSDHLSPHALTATTLIGRATDAHASLPLPCSLPPSPSVEGHRISRTCCVRCVVCYNEFLNGTAGRLDADLPSSYLWSDLKTMFHLFGKLQKRQLQRNPPNGSMGNGSASCFNFFPLIASYSTAKLNCVG